jgi:hypothetical protein
MYHAVTLKAGGDTVQKWVKGSNQLDMATSTKTVFSLKVGDKKQLIFKMQKDDGDLARCGKGCGGLTVNGQSSPF